MCSIEHVLAEVVAMLAHRLPTAIGLDEEIVVTAHVRFPLEFPLPVYPGPYVRLNDLRSEMSSPREYSLDLPSPGPRAQVVVISDPGATGWCFGITALA